MRDETLESLIVVTSSSIPREREKERKRIGEFM